MKLDFSSFEKALSRLERAIERSRKAPKDEELRDAVIQRFEYSMDLAWKFLQRILRHAGVQESAIRTKRDLFREGATMALLADPAKWFAYYEARNETSHSYDEEVARRVYAQATDFPSDARQLLDALRKADHD